MKAVDIRRVSVIGAGLMGHGIAQEFALAGYEVDLHDLTEGILQEALARIQDNLRILQGISLVSPEAAGPVPERIHTSASLEESCRNADLLVETVSEDLGLKKHLFNQFDRYCPKPTILASNTSSFLPSQLASLTQRPGKVAVTHYFNPPYLLPLVEIVRGPATTKETVQTLHDLLSRLGKKPVIVKKEILGFIGNRLQMALLREALSLLELGVATAQDVDTVIQNGFGRRLAAAGIFEIFDIAGLDIVSEVASNVLPDMESTRDASSLVRDKVQAGQLGVKTGKGFHDWTQDRAQVTKERIATVLAAVEQLSSQPSARK